MRVHLHGNKDEFASQLLTIEDSKYSIDTSPEIIQLSEHVGTFACCHRFLTLPGLETSHWMLFQLHICTSI